MTLKYRGIAYQVNSTNINTPQTQTSAKYRGQSYLLRQFVVPRETSDASSMTYRGVCYENANISRPQSIPQMSINSSVA